ncbi:unnamed protein product [Bemisia tabaci]|uniref:Elongator complex protein 1 n=1 Tax=Bemisia tabaci TaxID=7038 RepID=A0A9P0A1T2_BEMTA|nr:unnamed protein product [Bemisia tabaci]
MRNLTILKNLCFRVNELADCEHIATGINDANLRFNSSPLVYFYKSGTIYSYDPTSEEKSTILDLKTYYGITDPPKLVALDFHQISQSIIVIVSSGDVLSIPVVEVSSFTAECVGTVESGIKAMSWSPDEGIVALITNEEKLILMSSLFDLIAEVDLLNSATTNEFISVGWGKKETQFHGSEGKQAAKQKVDILSADPAEDDKMIRITWKGDCSEFAVSYFCPFNNIRCIKVFNNEGALKSVGEPVGGLEESLAWRPSGNLIASTCLLPNKHIVAFFEKNGLRHGEFNLPENIKVKNLFWNADSNILSALCHDTVSNKDCVLLWSVGNYHWYLKQKLSFDSNISWLKWDAQNSYRMYTLLTDGTFIMYDWMFRVDQSDNSCTDSEAFVCVIDGTNLLLTPFKKCVIPPPMCKQTLSIPTFINSMSFLKNSSNADNVNDFCIFGSDKGYLCRYNISNSQHMLAESFEYPDNNELCLHHWLWTSASQFCCIGSNSKLENTLYVMDLKFEKLEVRHSIVLESAVFTLTKVMNDLIIQLDDGKLLLFCMSTQTFKPFSSETLPEPCSHVIFDTNLFALSLTHRLYMYDQLVATGVTSLHYQRPFLIATTTKHRLLICESQSNKVCEEVSLRNTERGALIVTTTGLSVILQIPRGNLETVQPRAMTVLNAGKLLDSKNYLAAMSLLRKQRIDLNLIVDHNPHVFLQDIPTFLQQIEDIAWISLFISELHNEDTTQGIYAAYYRRPTNSVLSLSNKVDTVCKAMCKEMTARSIDTYCHPILGTYVKTGQMEEALKIAQTDKALKHLLFLVDIDTLYETALAIYDLEVALKIASKSQKDPKEYVPFLNLLKSMEPNYRKFTIDKQARKYASAIKHLSACENKFEELETFMVEFSLYSTAITLFPAEDPRYKKVARKYGEYLLSKRLYEEAAFMFEESDSLSDAVSAFSKAGLWRECITLTGRLNYSETELNTLLSATIKTLRSMGNYSDAGYISLHHLHDAHQSVDIYLEGLLFSDAVYVAESHAPELISKIVEPSILQYSTAMLEVIHQFKEKFNRYIMRLKQVRVNKVNAANHDPDFLSDIQSETSSVSSFNTSNASSRSSRTSCRSARKQQRKLWSLKEGNPREEISLVQALSEIIKAAYNMTKEVHKVQRFLLRSKEGSKAKLLQHSLAELLSLIKDNQSVIWPANDEDGELVSVEDAMLKHPPAIQLEKHWEWSIFN